MIILTAKDTIDDKVEFLRGGADDYVTKPFDIKRSNCQSGSADQKGRNNREKRGGTPIYYQELELIRVILTVKVGNTEIAS